MYPDPTILIMERGPSKITIALAEAIADPDREVHRQTAEIAPGASSGPAKLGEREALVISSREKARMISREGQSLWVQTSEGPGAASGLDRIAGGWRWTSPEQ